MRLFFGKLGFVHRHLWGRNRLYQVSILVGPASLAGGLLALAVWGASHGGFGVALPHWAKLPVSNNVWNMANGPPVVQPTAPLPLIDATGALAGYKPGWRMTIRRFTVDAAYEVNIDQDALTAFSLDEPKLDMARVIAEAPKIPLYIADGWAMLAVKTAGIYTLSLRFDRPADQPADCLVRLFLGTKRVTSSVEIGVINSFSHTLDGTRFDFKPGLYQIYWAFSCWHDHEVTAPGTLTLMVAHPGEAEMAPALADDVVHKDSLRPLK